MKNNQNIFIKFLSILPAISIFFLMSCTKTDFNEGIRVANLNEIVAGNGSFSLLNTAVTRAGAGSILTGSEELTLFAPNNDAFIASGFFSNDAVNGADATFLTDLLTYHLTSGRVMSGSLNNGNVNTRNTGKNFTVNISSNTIQLTGLGYAANTSNVIIKDVTAANGMFHVLNRIIFPNTVTIASLITNNGEFDILEKALNRAGLLATFGGTNAMTLFAPTDAAFIKYLNVTNEANAIAAIDGINTTQLGNILSYHGLNTRVASSDIPTAVNNPVNTLLATNGTIYTTKNANGVFINGAKVLYADIQANNGLFHIVDEVLSPAIGNLIQTAQADANLSFLVAALTRASQGSTNLNNVLATTNPLTIFAPTNTAFMNAGYTNIATIEAADPDALANILKYHVIDARAFSSSLKDGDEKSSLLSGNKFKVAISGGVQILDAKGNTAKVSKANIVATNGVVHVIDKVLKYN
jgi:uncharacterized surface protein with fasciclin (FAS1) repeats